MLTQILSKQCTRQTRRAQKTKNQQSHVTYPRSSLHWFVRAQWTVADEEEEEEEEEDVPLEAAVLSLTCAA